MASGIHAEIEVSEVDSCPVSTVSDDVEVESVKISKRTASETTNVIGEVTVDHSDDAETDIQFAEEVFSDDSTSVYRYTHSNSACPCMRVPNHGCPIRDIQAESGRILLSFITPNVETLQAVIADLQSYTDVTVRRLTRSGGRVDGRSLLVVDRNAFTDRQYEVLETAHRMGYFASPKEANSETVADELGISTPTFVEHLSVAQSKLLEQIVSQ
ncbi:helix-turn-helix domain-containing protein [Haladaptatus sp. DFWS20]|uniref:helix-turn-helix domain-containing protein n=1 Tax=Haladaptatus sp. DFWS20 TaxID=3403467 RepID=UPI003EB9D90C